MNEKAKVSRVMNSSEFKNKLSETNGNEFLREFWKVQGTHTEVQLQQYVEDRNTKLSGEAEYEQASLEMETVAELIRLSVLAETMAAENYTAANKELNLAHKERIDTFSPLKTPKKTRSTPTKKKSDDLTELLSPLMDRKAKAAGTEGLESFGMILDLAEKMKKFSVDKGMPTPIRNLSMKHLENLGTKINTKHTDATIEYLENHVHEWLLRRQDIAKATAKLIANKVRTQAIQEKYAKIFHTQDSILRSEISTVFGIILDDTDKGLMTVELYATIKTDVDTDSKIKVWRTNSDIRSFINWIRKNANNKDNMAVYDRIWATMTIIPGGKLGIRTSLPVFFEEYLKSSKEIEDVIERSSDIKLLLLLNLHKKFKIYFNENNAFQPLFQSWCRIEGDPEKREFPTSIEEYMLVVNRYIKSYAVSVSVSSKVTSWMSKDRSQSAVVAAANLAPIPRQTDAGATPYSGPTPYCMVCRKPHHTWYCRYIDEGARKAFHPFYTKARSEQRVIKDDKGVKGDESTSQSPKKPRRRKTKAASKTRNGSESMQMASTLTTYQEIEDESLHFFDEDEDSVNYGFPSKFKSLSMVVGEKQLQEMLIVDEESSGSDDIDGSDPSLRDSENTDSIDRESSVTDDGDKSCDSSFIYSEDSDICGWDSEDGDRGRSDRIRRTDLMTNRQRLRYLGISEYPDFEEDYLEIDRENFEERDTLYALEFEPELDMESYIRETYEYIDVDNEPDNLVSDLEISLNVADIYREARWKGMVYDKANVRPFTSISEDNQSEYQIYWEDKSCRDLERIYPQLSPKFVTILKLWKIADKRYYQKLIDKISAIHVRVSQSNWERIQSFVLNMAHANDKYWLFKCNLRTVYITCLA